MAFLCFRLSRIRLRDRTFVTRCVHGGHSVVVRTRRDALVNVEGPPDGPRSDEGTGDGSPVGRVPPVDVVVVDPVGAWVGVPGHNDVADLSVRIRSDGYPRHPP